MRKMLVFVALCALACSKDEVPDSKGFKWPYGQPKQADTTFTNLNQLTNYATSFSSATQLLTQTNWKTFRDNSFTLSADGDTIFSRVNLPGKFWIFNFHQSSNSGQFAINSSKGSIHQRIELFTTFFIVGDTNRYLIKDVTLNTDSTFSFTLNNKSRVDSLNRITTITLQSFK